MSKLERLLIELALAVDEARNRLMVKVKPGQADPRD